MTLESSRSASIVSQMLAAPFHSREHQNLRFDMIERRLLGSEGVCRYCLSILSGQDCFSLSSEDFIHQLARFVASRTSPQTESVCGDLQSTQFLADFMLYLLREHEDSDRPLRRRGKQERAIELLLRDPSLSDEKIQGRLSTTANQMRRWSNYQLLRKTIRLSRS
jgi:hypothetical protein